MTGLAVLGGFVLDTLFGDPAWLPHPVVLMGKAISALEKRLRARLPKTPQGELLGGGIVGISRYSQKAEACKQFFHWYYSADVASLLVRLGGTSPIVDAYEDFQNYSIFPWMNTSKKSFGLGQRGVINQTPERFSIPKYEFAVGTAVRNVVQDLMTPEDASRMAQALYDAADPVCR